MARPCDERGAAGGLDDEGLVAGRPAQAGGDVSTGDTGPDAVQLYGLDLASRALDQISVLPHTVEVVAGEQEDLPLASIWRAHRVAPESELPLESDMVFASAAGTTISASRQAAARRRGITHATGSAAGD